MKNRHIVPSLLLMTVALCGSVSTSAMDRNEYVGLVMEILRAHVYLLQELPVVHRNKYSDNLVRHAIAIERTFGLLGPMEWHTVQSAAIRTESRGTNDEFDEEMFEGLARTSQNALKNIVRSAHDTIEQQNADGLLLAIDEMKQSCNNCHSLLPKSVAPDLWGPLPRK